MTTTLILRYVEERGGPQAVAATVEAAGVPFTVAELDDPSRWVGYDTRIRLFEAATAVLGDPRAPWEIGAAALRHGLHHAIVPLLRGFGSPREVYRQLPRAVPKFTTTSTMDLVECAGDEATIRYRLHEGHTHSRLDCEYAQGLISGVPVIFGLPPARIRHPECESDGSSACVYHVRWERRRRWWSRAARRESADLGLTALRVQLEEFQDAAADLVSSDDVEEVLERIVRRAVAAVLAPAYLLVLDGGDGVMARHHGLDAERAERLAQLLVAGESLGESAVVVDIASARHRHGRLAAVYQPGHLPLDGDHSLLRAYARHAAAALDLLTALEGSRLEQRRTAALLGLAHELAAVDTAAEVATVVAQAAPAIIGCRAAGILLWDHEAGALGVVATSGLGRRPDDVLSGAEFRADQSPELVEMLTHHSPRMLRREQASPEIAAAMLAIGAASLVVVPLLAGDTLLGVAVAVSDTEPGTAAEQTALARLAGVGDQAAAALQNARLLSTVRRQAHHDSLTGLANRVLFSQRLDAVLERQGEAAWTAVLFCDLDNFKHVNDELGHSAGDELLRQVAGRLREAVGPEHVIARLGGDEFAVAMRAPDERTAVALGRRCVDSVTAPFPIDGQELRVTMSVGVALHAGPDGRGERMLAASDRAMYEAKRRGRNQVVVGGDSTQGAPGPSLQAELRTAVEEGHLRLHFQPVVDVSQPGMARVVGAEALVRWDHPRLGLLSPAAFLPLAEETGQITDIDLWVLEAACGWLAATPAPESGVLHIAVNVAGRTLNDPRFLSTVRGALNRHGLAPRQLVLEIVESRSLADLPGVVERLVELRQLGVRVSLDDFGTGYSTLAWLKNLPVDQIKIDRSFITALPEQASVALVRGVLALAAELGVEVVAEGVELFEQLEALREAECHLVQGYLLGRPEVEPSLQTRAVGAHPVA
ncbi:putative bifunctional diguanylate cyclase/phosphodiesterase [Cellulomonas timonensis]|uniref:putative bifunctional diguanylate cyclase/phosphodiesterase n=1 Tax=Cellulomonas timonensis TaxID=1689271 RepID=UPI0018FEFA84|nr:EAL domain-containing protein [Cellulomonas timonensis]